MRWRCLPPLAAAVLLLCRPAAAQTDQAVGLSLGAEPLTVALPLSSSTRQVLRDARHGGAPVALVVQGIALPTDDRAIRIHIFVEKPDASARTSPEDPRFVGSIPLMLTLGTAGTASGAFDLSGVDIEPGAALRVTLVPVTGIDERPQGFRLPVARVAVEPR